MNLPELDFKEIIFLQEQSSDEHFMDICEDTTLSSHTTLSNGIQSESSPSLSLQTPQLRDTPKQTPEISKKDNIKYKLYNRNTIASPLSSDTFSTSGFKLIGDSVKSAAAESNSMLNLLRIYGGMDNLSVGRVEESSRTDENIEFFNEYFSNKHSVLHKLRHLPKPDYQSNSYSAT
jgi:hypothetical protein